MGSMAGRFGFATKRKAPALDNRGLRSIDYGVENANTWLPLSIPQTPPPLPTLSETSEPGTCTKAMGVVEVPKR